MKTDSTAELMDESRLVLREMAAAGETGWERITADDVEITWAHFRAANGPVMTPEEMEAVRTKLIAGRKAVIGGGAMRVYTLFWPTAGVGGAR